MQFKNLSSFVSFLRSQGELREICAQVDPHLELAEIHRRTIAESGKTLLFSNVKGSKIPVVTNLFGTEKRVEMAFGKPSEKLVSNLVRLVEKSHDLGLKTIWKNRSDFSRLAKIGIKSVRCGDVAQVVQTKPRLSELPVITSWVEDGGAFFTLPLVYTEHPKTGVSNLGIYRLHRYDDETTGLHMQIGKGGGFHLSAAKELRQKLPVNIFLGGPPVLTLAAIAPLPENVPEILFASLLLENKIKLFQHELSPLPIIAEAELALLGSCDPEELRSEGPFGDHYGYYSLAHDFPVFHCRAILRRENAIYPATVVGKPRQEDYYIGNYLQKLLSPIFPLVMPTILDLWSYGETGFHSLAAAVVHERYKREAMVSGFRVLGEGQLSLTKFLLLVDKKQDLENFPSLLEYVLARANFRTDLYVFGNLSMDTLDYAGTKLNEGSKGVLLGMGEPIRDLPGVFQGEIPQGVAKIRVFSKGCLVLSGVSYLEEKDFAQRIANFSAFRAWPFIVLCDDADFTVSSSANFLWSVFTRFEPARDLIGRNVLAEHFHVGIDPPLVIDSRMKPWYPKEVECDEKTEKLVDKRWSEYLK